MPRRDRRTTPAARPRPPRRRDHQQRGHDGPLRRRGGLGHPAHLHARRGGRDPRPRTGAAGRGPGRSARRIPDLGTAGGDGGPRRHRHPLPRWPGTLPRLRDDGDAGQRAPPSLLERRPGRGGGARGRRRPRGPSPGRRDLRRERRLRPPRPHPGPPGGDGGGGRRCRRPLPAPPGAHRVAMAAVDAAADAGYRPDLGPAWEVAKVYWCCVPRSVLQKGIEALARAGEQTLFEGVTSADDIPFAVSDEEVAAAVDGRAFADRKDAAMRAHPTQITVDGPFFALSTSLGQEVLGIEYYRLVHGKRGPAGAGPHGWEDDLFAGLAG